LLAVDILNLIREEAPVSCSNVFNVLLRIRLTGKETHKRGGENSTRQDRKLHSSDVDSVLALRRGVVPGATALLPLQATSTAARALQTTRPRRSRYTNELHTRARPTLFLVPSRPVRTNQLNGQPVAVKAAPSFFASH